MLAAGLALAIHWLFLEYGAVLLRKKSPFIQRPRIVTLALVPHRSPRPHPEKKYSGASPKKPVALPEKRDHQPAVEPGPEKEVLPAPTKARLPLKELSTPTPKRVTRPKKKVAKRPEKAVTSPKPVKASLAREKKRPSEPIPDPAIAPGPGQTNSLDPMPDILDQHGPLTEETALSSPAGQEVKNARPDYLRNPKPRYPKRARRRGYQGTVILEVLVDRTGRVDDLRVLTSSGHQILDKAARQSVKTWLFQPGMVGDKRVEMWVRVPVQFELKGR